MPTTCSRLRAGIESPAGPASPRSPWPGALNAKAACSRFLRPAVDPRQSWQGRRRDDGNDRVDRIARRGDGIGPCGLAWRGISGRGRGRAGGLHPGQVAVAPVAPASKAAASPTLRRGCLPSQADQFFRPPRRRPPLRLLPLRFPSLRLPLPRFPPLRPLLPRPRVWERAGWRPAIRRSYLPMMTSHR